MAHWNRTLLSAVLGMPALMLLGCTFGTAPVLGTLDGEAGSGGAAAGNASTSGGSGAKSPGGGVAGVAGKGGAAGVAGAISGVGPDFSGSFVQYVVPQLSIGPSVCLPIQLSLGDDGDPDCVMVVASPLTSGCDSPGLAPLAADQSSFWRGQMTRSRWCGEAGKPDCADFNLCELLPAAGNDRASCLFSANLPSSSDLTGFCYVDPSQGIGNPAVVAPCYETDARMLRVLNTIAESEHLMLACSVHKATAPVPAVPQPLGSPCIPSDERNPSFPGYSASEVNVLEASDCESNVCLMDHFQGRVSCPYGQQLGEAKCFLPFSDEVVTTQIQSQLVERPAKDTAICSCRCDGPGPGPFCACPSGMVCSHLIDSLGLAGDSWEGSYCTKQGAEPIRPDMGRMWCGADGYDCGPARPYPPQNP